MDQWDVNIKSQGITNSIMGKTEGKHRLTKNAIWNVGVFGHAAQRFFPGIENKKNINVRPTQVWLWRCSKVLGLLSGCPKR
jgi:hypothetical protein